MTARSVFILLSWLISGRLDAAEPQFVRGDADADGGLNITDAVAMLGCSFLGTECPACADAADVNDDGQNNITDPVYLLNFLFLGQAPPPNPHQACGEDPTTDELDCVSFPRCVVTHPDAIATARGDLIVVPIDHASLVLRWDEKAIYVDPVGGAGRFTGLPAPDFIVVTHTHGDHMSAATIRALAVDGTDLLVPQAVATAIASAGGAGKATVRVLRNGEKVEVDGVEIEAVPMYNLTAGRLQNHPQGEGNGYVLDLAGTRVYVSGDTEDIPEMRALQNVACAFLCMNLPFTMTPEQAASATIEFKPRVVYPYHYRGQDTARFKMLVEAGTDAVEVRLRNWYP